jgi:hypothetical protein
MFKKKIVSLSLFVAFFSSAETFKFEDFKIVLDVNESTVSASNCRKDSCTDHKIETTKLIDIVTESIEKYELALEDIDTYSVDIERIFHKNKKIKARVIYDEMNKKSYVLTGSEDLNVNIPIDEKSTKKERKDLLADVIKYQLDRESKTLKMLESGKLPASADFDSFNEYQEFTNYYTIAYASDKR